MTDTIQLTGPQAVALNRQAHESMALAAAASVDREAAAQALTRFDHLQAITEQFTDRDLEDGAVLTAPAELVVELVEKELYDAGTALCEQCKTDPLVLEELDRSLERVIALRDLMAFIAPALEARVVAAR